MNPKVDDFLSRAKKWQDELTKLRALALSCGLTEELKWGKPCYTFEGSNVVILLGFKEYCAVLFCKGALLQDAKEILVRPTENTQAARQARFTKSADIVKNQATLKTYIREAMEVEKAGLEVPYKDISEHKVPEEFQNRLDKSPKLKTAFKALTPGRQRAYLLHFSSAKQSKTRESRIEKCEPQILAGKGLDD
jgi:uncharacterized protein YdeI (YjbR/CyaY-like superfamily)